MYNMSLEVDKVTESFKKGYKLKISKPMDPSYYIWNNMDNKSFISFILMAVKFLVLLLICSLVVVVIFYINYTYGFYQEDCY